MEIAPKYLISKKMESFREVNIIGSLLRSK